MDEVVCPECGDSITWHTGSGGPRCSLTDNGVAQRVYRAQREAAGTTGEAGA